MPASIVPNKSDRDEKQVKEGGFRSKHDLETLREHVDVARQRGLSTEIEDVLVLARS
jgi:hypothetical protein